MLGKEIVSKSEKGDSSSESFVSEITISESGESVNSDDYEVMKQYKMLKRQHETLEKRNIRRKRYMEIKKQLEDMQQKAKRGGYNIERQLRMF